MISKNFNESLKEILLKSNLTQRKLANISRLHESTVSKYVNKRIPTYRTTIKLAKALGLFPVAIYNQDNKIIQIGRLNTDMYPLDVIKQVFKEKKGKTKFYATEFVKEIQGNDTSFHRFDNGEQSPSLNYLEKCYRALNLSWKYFISEEEIKQAGEYGLFVKGRLLAELEISEKIINSVHLNCSNEEAYFKNLKHLMNGWSRLEKDLLKVS